MRNGFALNIFFPVALAFVVAGCDHDKNVEEQSSGEAPGESMVTLSPASIKEIGLQTETAAQKPFIRYTVIPAKVTTDQDNEAIVGSLVQGRVCKVLVKTGDHVRAGQTLMLVEGLEIGEIKADFISARANLAYQKANYERQKKLVEENAGAQKNLLESRNEYEKARAEYSAQKNRISAIGVTEAEMSDSAVSASDEHASATIAIASPIGGIVVERNVVTGQLIEAATTAFKIVNLNSVWVDGQMYEKDIGKIGENGSVDFVAASFPDELFRGRVAYVGRMIDEKTRTITLRAEFGNTAGKLLPQMFGELRVPDVQSSTAIPVPEEAVVKIDNADYVFVRRSDTTFEKTPVTVGHIERETAEIAKGLEAGEQVVVKGAFYLKSELLKASFGEGE